MSEALQKIEPIEFAFANDTAYGLALSGRDRAGKPFYKKDCVEGPIAISGVMCVWTIFAMVALAVGVATPLALWWWVPVILPWAVAAPFISRQRRKFKKELTETLSNPLEQLKWRLAESIRVFNARVKLLNHWLEGYELGCTDSDGDKLGAIHALMAESRECLEHSKRNILWREDGKALAQMDLGPELAASFARLTEAEAEFRSYVSVLGEDSGLPAKELLGQEMDQVEIEAELQGLLPAKTD